METLKEEGISGGIWENETRIGTATDGSRWLIKFEGKEIDNEVVSYQLAQAFFGGIVPETHALFIEGRYASAQRMVTGSSIHDLDERDMNDLLNKVREPQVLQDLANMVTLDFQIGNTDRHGNNWFIMDNGRIAAIDNGFATEDFDMPFIQAMRPIYRVLLMDDCSRTPTLISAFRTVVARCSGQAEKVRDIASEYSFENFPTHDLSGRWQIRLDLLTKKLDQWQQELGVFCDANPAT